MAETHDEGTNDLTLGQLLERGLSAAQRVTSADSPNDVAIQKTLHAALSDLTLCSSLISHLGMLSPNETIDDINTRDLRCILVDGLRGELEVLAKTKGGKERIEWITKARDHFRTYIELVDRYEIIPEDRRSVFAGPQHATQDPTRRRESKIAQFKMEREIKGKLEELRRRRLARRAPRAATTSTAEPLASEEDLAYESDDDNTEVSRPLFINLLLLHYLQANSELSSIEQELELLKAGMAMSDLPSPHELRGREAGREGEDESSWRVDKLTDAAGGPLLDPKGKVLRPFTILPSENSHLNTRLRLKSEVFRSGHRLPTMSIDEFLDNEKAAGNILQGGGPASSAAVDQERKDQQAEKEDDTEGGYAREEREIQKLRDQDDWKDTHRKGEGNMHNRG